MKLTLLEIIGNAVQLLLLVVLPVVLAIKNWDTTLKAIKMLLKFVITSTPKVIEFIIPILAWMIRSLPEDSNSGSSGSGGSELSAKQRHDMDSNGLSRSEATANPRW
jgi:hypothetical protein